MEFRQLSYFVRVAELGGISRAAAALQIAQPAVSRQIAALEAEFGLDLLLRHGRGVDLTEPGAQLLDHARDILERVERARAEIAAAPTALGTVTIGMPTSAAELLAAALVQRFKQRFPGGELRLLEGFGGHLQEWLAHDRIDVALMYDPPASQSFVSETILREDLWLIAPPDAPETARAGCPLAELNGLPLVLPSSSNNLRRRVQRELLARKIRLSLVAEVDSLAGIRDLVARGEAFSVLNHSSVANEINQGRLSGTPLVKPNLSRDIGLVTAGHRPLSRLARETLAETRGLLLQLQRSGHWPSVLAKKAKAASI